MSQSRMSPFIALLALRANILSVILRRPLASADPMACVDVLPMFNHATREAFAIALITRRLQSDDP